MADIELVIKIPEEDFEIMKHNIAVDNPLCPLSQEKMVAIVAHGTPLPKGYWILRNSFLVPYKCSKCNYESEKYDNYCPNCGAKMI